MHRVSVRARPVRRASIARPWLAPWAAGTVLAAAGVLAAAPLPAGAAMAGPLPSPGPAIAGWGVNNEGEMGTGTATGPLVLVPRVAALPPGTQITQISPGCDFALALTSTGSVLAWGNNTLGELGIGSTKLKSSPVPLPVRLPLGSSRAVAVGGGCEHAMVLTSSGQVLDWGAGGLLGNGSVAPSASPVQVQLPAGDPAIRISSGASANFSLALLAQIPQA